MPVPLFQVVHMLRDPVHPRAEIVPDVFGLATVVPTMVRAPKMGTWTSSSHVVKQFGSHDGLTTFMLNPSYIVDCDMFRGGDTRGIYNAKTRLMLERRPQVALSYLKSQPQEAQGLQGAFDSAPIVTEDKRQRARDGSTYVSVLDAYDGWKKLVNKDTDDATADDATADDAKIYVVLHPGRASQVGRGPFPPLYLTRHDQLPELKQLVYCVLQHSPALLKRLESVANTDVANVVQAVQKSKVMVDELDEQRQRKAWQDCRSSLDLIIPTASRSMEEIWIRGFDLPQEHVLSSLDDQEALQGVVEEAEVFLVIGHQNPDRLPPEQVGASHILQAIYTGQDFRWRWEEGMEMQRETRPPWSSSASIATTVAVYIKKQRQDRCLAAVKSAMSTACNWLKCAVHDEHLCWVTRLHLRTCGQERCNNLASVKCVANHHCQVGLCRRHATSLEKEAKEVSLTCLMGVRPPPPEDALRLEEARSNRSALQRYLDECHTFEGDEPLPVHTFPMLAYGCNQEQMLDELIPLYARMDHVPVHEVQGGHLPGHYFINQALGVLKRSGRSLKVNNHPVLANMVSMAADNPVPLLYPEAMLFPRLFWDAVPGVGSIIGALPSFMYVNDGKSATKTSNLLSLSEHLAIRCRDMLLPTSRTPAYQHFAFDVLANTYLKGNSAEWAMCRGLGYIPEVSRLFFVVVV